MATHKTILPRRLESEVVDALEHARIVAVLGPRQAGKSTLVTTVKAKHAVAEYVTLDEPTLLEQAIDDPTGFLAHRAAPLAIDEVQRAPELLLAMKRIVDEDTTPGRFIITGSANLLRMRNVPDLLPGRIDYLRLWPLSQGEIEQRHERFIDTLFAGSTPQVNDAPVGFAHYAERIGAGGFPDAVRRSGRARDRWFDGYIASSLPAVLEDVSAADPASVERTLRAVAASSASTLNYSALSRKLGIDDKSVRAHIEALEQLMLVRRHTPWFTNLLKRQTKAAKVYVIDTGLWANLIGAGPERLAADPELAGRAAETFAVSELIKQAEWSDTRVSIHHFRDRDQREVDIVLEARDGRVACIEVKSAATVRARDFRPMRHIKEHIGDRFVQGVVLYTGAATVRFGDDMAAVPLCGLWEGRRPNFRTQPTTQHDPSGDPQIVSRTRTVPYGPF